MFRKIVYTSIFLVFISVFVAFKYGRRIWVPILVKFTGGRTVEDVHRLYGSDAQSRLRPFFEKSLIKYPPEKIILIAFKKEMTIELWAGSESNNKKLIKKYPILAASGKLGPKLKEGDHQVPEGIYRITALNPNSSFHLSMRLDYPNEQDQKQAEKEGRTGIGDDIYIHGKAASIGCLAIGDMAIEELFILTSQIKNENVVVIITPADFRKVDYRNYIISDIPWTKGLYENIANELLKYVKKK